MPAAAPPPAPGLRLYGRRQGKPLRANAQKLLAELLPRLRVEIAENFTLEKIFTPMPRHLTLEVGFGGGEHLAALAAMQPHNAFIGCEPFINGVAALLKLIAAQNLKNIRIFPDDARLLLDALPPQCLDLVCVFFPDPWPKKRHWERRFMNTANLARLARGMKTGAELRFASDHADLAGWMAEQVAVHQNFAPAPGTALGRWPSRPPHWPTTRYEQKSLAGVAVHYSFVRVNQG